MNLSLLCISSFLPLLTASVGLYDGLLSAYLSFRQEIMAPEGRRSMATNAATAKDKDTDETVRNMLKGTLVKFKEGDEKKQVEWKFPANLKKEEEKQICGVATRNLKTNADSMSRIVGGTPAQGGTWPWIVALGYLHKNGDIKFQCGGTLITQKHILTAAHCVDDKIMSELNMSLRSALLGATERYNETEHGTRHIPIAGRRVHEHFDRSSHANDIAMVTLDIPVTFTDQIRAACLPLSDQLMKNDYRSQNAFVAGWGTLKFGGQDTNKLQQLELPILAQEDCRKAYEPIKQVTDSRMICAGYINGSKDACQGDSGGPLVWQHDGAYFVIGVVSYGFHCAEPDYPGVYTRVSSFIDWINNTIYTLH